MKGAALLAMLSLGGLAAQTVNPGITAVPTRIVASVEPPPSGNADSFLLPAAPAPVSSLNDRLPGWIRLFAVERIRLDSVEGQNYRPGGDDTYLLVRFRLGTMLHPVRWIRVYSELQDARVAWQTPPVRPPNRNAWGIRQAYIQIGGDEDARFSLKVGRQEVNFGAGRLIGRSDWRNAGRTFDAALASFREGRYRLTAFSLSVVVPLVEGLSHHQSGAAIHGLYGGIDNVIPHSVLEPSVIWRVAPGYRTDAGIPAKLSEMTYGLRLAGVITRQVDYSAEGAAQWGHLATDSTSGWTTSLVGGYTATSLAWRPRVFVDYLYASGDGQPGDGHRTTWHQLHPTHHDRNGLADQIGWQNIRSVRTGVRFVPARSWAVAATVADWALANAKDALYDTSGAVVAKDPGGHAGTHIGVELDLETSYRLNRQMDVVAGIARILPGSFLKHTTPGRPYMYPYIGMNYVF